MGDELLDVAVQDEPLFGDMVGDVVGDLQAGLAAPEVDDGVIEIEMALDRGLKQLQAQRPCSRSF